MTVKSQIFLGFDCKAGKNQENLRLKNTTHVSLIHEVASLSKLPVKQYIRQ